MKLKAINKKDHYYELIVEFSVFGETYETVFIGTHDVDLSTRMCNACPLNKDCFENDTLKWELCCYLELAYQTPLPSVDIGVIYMKPDDALKIKEVIDKKIGRELENACKPTKNETNEQPKSYESEFELL